MNRYEGRSSKNYLKRNTIFNLALIVVLIVIALFFPKFGFDKKSDITFRFASDSVTFSCPKQEDIVVPFNAIEDMTLQDSFKPGNLVSGVLDDKNCYGIFRDSSGSEYTTAITRKETTALKITTADKTYYINFGDKKITKQFPESVQDALNADAENSEAK